MIKIQNDHTKYDYFLSIIFQIDLKSIKLFVGINYGADKPSIAIAISNHVIFMRTDFYCYGGRVLYTLCVRPLKGHITSLNLVRDDQGQNHLI